MRFAERVAEQHLVRVRGWRVAEEQRLAAQAQRARRRPPAPDWLLERGIGVGARPQLIHKGDCWDLNDRCRPITRDEARRWIVEHIPACGQCRPDTALELLD
nr:DUF6233 domain-containing protein [Streptomyces sp. SID11385]